MRRIWTRVKRAMFVRGNVAIGKRFHMGMLSYVSSPDALEIGNDVYVGKFCTIQCSGTIGNCVLIANNVGIVGRRDHDMKAVGIPIRLAPWVGDTPGLAGNASNRVIIDSDVWVGFGAILLSGIRIGRGAVVAAGAVVVADVAPYDIVAGNPARPVGRRFNDADILAHESQLFGMTES